MKLSCTSVMLPRWDLDQTFDKLAEHGYDGVELRCRYIKDDAPEEPSFWGRHLADVSPDNIVDRAGEIQAASKRSGVKVVALAPQALVSEHDLIDKLFAGDVIRRFAATQHKPGSDRDSSNYAAADSQYFGVL